MVGGAIRSASLTSVPKLLGEVYCLDNAQGAAEDEEAADAGRPLRACAIAGMGGDSAHCSAVAIEQPLALVAPVYDISTTQRDGADGTRILRTFGRRGGAVFRGANRPGVCARETVFPQLIHRSFGKTAASEYDFAVVSHSPSSDRLPGSASLLDRRCNPDSPEGVLFRGAGGIGWRRTDLRSKCESGARAIRDLCAARGIDHRHPRSGPLSALVRSGHLGIGCSA